MKKKEKAELRQKTPEELRKMVAQAQEKLIKLKMEIKIQKIKNIRAVARGRDEIAVLLSLLKEKEEEEK